MGHRGCVRIVYIGSAADGVFFLTVIWSNLGVPIMINPVYSDVIE